MSRAALPRSAVRHRLAAGSAAVALLGTPAVGQQASSPASATAPARTIDAVDPFIGTGGEGHTFPGAVAPFGMVQLSPDTDTSCVIRECYAHAAGYRHDDPTI